MKRHDRHIINIKEVKNNVLTTTDILATSYEDAINYVKIFKNDNSEIRIYNEDERLVYSKTKNKKSSNHGNNNNHGNNGGNSGNNENDNEHNVYHYNYVTHEHYTTHEHGDDDDTYL